jgi:hypothetical protein
VRATQTGQRPAALPGFIRLPQRGHFETSVTLERIGFWREG